MGKVWEGEEEKACHPRLVPVWMVVVQYREMYAYFFMLFLAPYPRTSYVISYLIFWGNSKVQVNDMR